ncbi:MAG TPA: GAF domain-containing protein, partial [Polyangiales bacterium]
MTDSQGAGAGADQTRRDALLDAQRSVLEMMVHGRALPVILTKLCQIVEQQAGGAACAQIFLLEAERRLYSAAAPSLPDSFIQAIDGIEIAPDLGTCCAAAARAEPVITPDLASCPGWQALRDLPLALGLKAAWSMPIMSAHGKVLGTFGTYFKETRPPSAQERQLVQMLAPTAALAIERHRSDELLRENLARSVFLSELAAATQPLVEASDVVATTSRLLAEHLKVQRCAYAEIEDEQVFVITGDYTAGVPSIVGRWPVAAFGPRCAADMLAGRAYVVDDVESDPDIGPEHLPAYRATTIRAVVCVPLCKSGIFSAAMAVHQTSARRWTSNEVELVSLVVARCWEALERARVTRTLRESEARYRAMVEASPECVMLVAADGTLLQINPAGLRMLEAPDEQSALGRSVYDSIAPEHRARFRAFNEQVCQGRGGTLEYEVVSRSGTRRTLESTAVPLAAAAGGFSQLAVTRDLTARVSAARALAMSR